MTIILVLAAVAATVYIVLKKLQLIGYRYRPMDEGYWPEEKEDLLSPSTDSSGVPYTTDQDFV